jgi:dUTP pyrophosphatase
MIKRKIKYVNFNKFYKLQKHGNWIDLSVSQDYILKSEEYKILDLGISMELPMYYEANIIPRSSLYKNFRIQQANSFGLIDSDYCGMDDRWGFPAISKLFISIPKSTRICQFSVRLSMNAPWYIKLLDLFTTFEFVEVDVLTKKSRGGFGSSGL